MGPGALPPHRPRDPRGGVFLVSQSPTVPAKPVKGPRLAPVSARKRARRAQRAARKANR
jgi:hypothetical protein